MTGQQAGTARRDLAGEAKETGGVTSALLLAYVEQVGGPTAVREVLRRCGLEHAEQELRDENTWFSWETKIELFETTAAVLEKPDFLREMGGVVLDINVAGGLKVALRTLGSPQFVIRNIVRANARFVRSHVLELQTLEDGHAVLRFTAIGDRPRYHRLDCVYTAGLLAVIPSLFGLPAATVEHHECAARGASACVFDLRWQESRNPLRQLAVGFAASGFAFGASLAVGLAALPIAAGVASLSVALVAEERWRWRRSQWRHLQHQIADSEEVNQRLFGSLQDLVSDLRLEEVVAKVTRNAQAAVGGKDFLLLVGEGDGLICQSSSQLPPGAVAAVEAWANGTPHALESTMLIDDVCSVEPLAQLAELPDSLCSLASSPLTRAGEPFGLLVSLGGQQQTFLPRDMLVLESYAAQVSIALGNAQLFQNERSLAAHDPLTGLLNHRSFHEALDAELERCVREQSVASLVLLDLDHFKQVNDEDGHASGDRVLRASARALSEVCRRDDLAFRIGGDEFALLLPRLTEAEALGVAERACEAIGAIDPRMAASAGVACAASDSAKDDLVAAADRRLYSAKRSPADGAARRGLATSSVFTARMASDMLIGALELHHASTVAHSGEVARLATAVAGRLRLDTSSRELVRQTALLHDLGKLAIPGEILDKPDRLTDDEWELIRRHPASGAEVLRSVPALSKLATAVRASHERWDGDGYPDGLRGEQIPVAARIVAVCDAFEAMTGDRSYRESKSLDDALRELQRCAGSQFDPAVVDAFVAELASVRPPERPRIPPVQAALGTTSNGARMRVAAPKR
jgi:diguanylate cyclase (GGDEF)-like protein/putative nucleotidyltransferase with HDIG domain